jgi:hypothetical protein
MFGIKEPSSPGIRKNLEPKPRPVRGFFFYIYIIGFKELSVPGIFKTFKELSGFVKEPAKTQAF